MPATARLGQGEPADRAAPGSVAVAGMARSCRKTGHCRDRSSPCADQVVARMQRSEIRGSISRITLRFIRTTLAAYCKLTTLRSAYGPNAMR